MQSPRSADSRDASSDFTRDPRIETPAGFRVAFVVFLDGDLVMSPEHIGVALMTAVLRRAGFSARIFEVNSSAEDAAIEAIVSEDPDLVCFTLMSLNVSTCRRACKTLRKSLPASSFAAGGPAASYSTLDVLNSIPELDFLCVGEGERTIFDVVQRLYLGESVEKCPGVAHLGREGLVANPPRALIHDLDALPYPARDQLEEHGGRLEFVRISTSRGCVAHCSFCSAPHVANRLQPGKAWRARSPRSVLDELCHLVERYGFRTFDFIDSTFEDPDGGRIGKARIAEIAQGIIDRGLDIYFNCCMRAENWSEADADLLALLKRSGLEKVNVGIESGNDSELRLWDKLATVEDNVRIIHLLRNHGIYLAMGFIQFHPYATLETITANAAFLRDHAGHNLRRLTERLEVYPGTSIEARLRSDGLLGEGYRSTMNVYDYRFRDKRVERLSTYFASLYNNTDYHERGVITEVSSVFAFETFNVKISVFVSRIMKAFGQDRHVADLVGEFSRDVQSIRDELGRFNHGFFMSVLDAVLEDRIERTDRARQLDEIEHYFAGCIRRIRDLQLRLGMNLHRHGCDVARISSTLLDAVRVVRTYTGSASPCW